MDEMDIETVDLHPKLYAANNDASIASRRLRLTIASLNSGVRRVARRDQSLRERYSVCIIPATNLYACPVCTVGPMPELKIYDF